MTVTVISLVSLWATIFLLIWAISKLRRHIDSVRADFSGYQHYIETTFENIDLFRTQDMLESKGERIDLSVLLQKHEDRLGSFVNYVEPVLTGYEVRISKNEAELIAQSEALNTLEGSVFVTPEATHNPNPTEPFIEQRPTSGDVITVQGQHFKVLGTR